MSTCGFVVNGSDASDYQQLYSHHSKNNILFCTIFPPVSLDPGMHFGLEVKGLSDFEFHKQCNLYVKNE